MFWLNRKMVYKAIIILIMYFALAASNEHMRLSYQVSIYGENQSNYCTGIILQRRLVLTIASCILKLNYPNLIVTAPDTNRSKYKFSVSNFSVFNSYNPTSFKNDIAVLRLNTPLPLGKDFKWIVLEEGEPFDKYCYTKFRIKNLLSSYYEEINLMEWSINNSKCQKIENIVNKQCGEFNLSKFKCSNTNALLSLYESTGSGVVCDNKLFAILSLISPIKVKLSYDCYYTAAYTEFTSVTPYFGWIFSFITQEEYADVLNGVYATSKPFQEENKSRLVTNNEEVQITTTEIYLPELLTSKSSHPMNSFYILMNFLGFIYIVINFIIF